MVYQYITSKAIIAKVFRDLRIQRSDWVNDGIEWIGEALDAIGASAQLEDHVYITKTYSHKAPLPSNLYLINEVRCGGFNSSATTKPKKEDFELLMTYGNADNHPSLVDSRNTDASVNTAEETFLLEPGYIKTSFEEDWILLSYKGFALDGDNFPMVPDHYEYKQALYWYIVMKLLEGGMVHPNPQISWTVGEDRWLKYCTQARNQAVMPDAAKYDQFLKSWVNLIPNYDRDLSRLEDGTDPIYDTNTVTLEDIKGL